MTPSMATCLYTPAFFSPCFWPSGLLAGCDSNGDDNGVVITPPGDGTPPDSNGGEPPATGSLSITNFHPDKARFAPGEPVNLTVTLENGEIEPFSGLVRLQLRHLDGEVLAEERQVTVGPGETTTETFTIDPPDTDFTGYLATATAGGGEPVSTGVDVSSTAVRYPRYGYISEFTEAARDLETDSLRQLAREYHLNMFQFYDWFWRHEKLIQFENGEIVSPWIDIFGRPNSWPVILDLVETAHEVNSLAMSYVMAYAAREGYGERWPISPLWGLFASPAVDDQLDISFEFGTSRPSLYLFNPAHPGWMDWLIPQYLQAIELGGFDGVHIDQFGPRYDVFGGDGQPVDLPNAFGVFLDNVKERLVAFDPENAACTFNLVDGEVNGWAVPEVAGRQNCDFLYSEVWFETNTYDELLGYIEYLRSFPGSRPVVLAAYSNYNEEVGPIHEAEDAAVLDGVAVAANHPGFTGTGFVDNFNEPGDSITWIVEGSDEPGNVTFVARFANATETVATRNLYVDGILVGTLRFGTRDQWSTWASDAWVQTLVEPGTHEVRLAFDEENVGAVNIDHLRLGQFDEDSVRLENAVMFGSGATHIQLGDNIQSLAHEYYPNRSKSLSAELRRALRHQYDFITAYENLLFDPALRFLGDAADVVAITTGQSLQIGEGGRLFTIQRARDDAEILHLINLIGVDDELWRNEAPPPQFQENIGVRYYAAAPEAITRVWMATPDFGALEPIPLEFTPGQDERGGYIEFTVPRLEYWDMIVMSRE